MPRGDRTGPIGIGPKDGRGRKYGGRGQNSTRKGLGRKKGEKKGTC